MCRNLRAPVKGAILFLLSGITGAGMVFRHHLNGTGDKSPGSPRLSFEDTSWSPRCPLFLSELQRMLSWVFGEVGLSN